MEASANMPTGEVTFLFSDIVGSTQRWERDAIAMKAALELHHAITRRSIERHEGSVVKDTGDGFMATFADPSAAVMAAVDLQRAIRAAGWDGDPLEVRVGLHTGSGVPVDGDYHGPTVNRCARVMDVAHGAQVVATSAVVDAVGTSDLVFEDLGEHRLKDLDRAVTLHQVMHPELPSRFPPLRSLAVTPNNLPHVTTPLLGRAAEIVEVGELLSTARLVTLTGAGGIGKTRLAYQVAAEHLEDFADGVWVAELGSTSEPELVAEVLASALGVPDAPGRPARDRILARLADRQVLLVVDNCEHLLDPVAELIHDVLERAPGVRALATSREPLAIPPEHVVAVPPLATDRGSAAVRLFLDRAAATGGDVPAEQELDQVAEICVRLDGLPLAIELAAARSRVLPLSDIADRLNERFTLLTGGSRTALPRQRTLEATVAWSYDLLDADVQLLLRRVSVFASAFSLDDVAAVCTDPPLSSGQTLDLVTELVDRSLLTREVDETARFRLLETIRAYARDRLHDVGDEEVTSLRDNHLAWAVAESAEAAAKLESREQVQWLERVRARIDDHRSAMRWAIAHDLWEQGATVASNLYRRWYVHGVREGREWLAAFVEASDRIPDPLLARVLFAYGSLVATMGDHDESTRALEQSVSLYEYLDNPRGLAYAQHYLVRSSWGARRRHEVRDLCERSLELFREVGDPVGIGLALMFVGIDEYERGRHDAGLDAMEESDAVLRTVGAPHLVAHGPEMMAWGLAARGDDVVAAQHFTEAIELYQTVGNPMCSAHCLQNVALLLTRHDPALAATLLGAMDAIREDIGVPVPPYERMSHEPAVDALERRFDQSELRELLSVGRQLGTAQALERALQAVRIVARGAPAGTSPL